jgi:hypothetical protein
VEVLLVSKSQDSETRRPFTRRASDLLGATIVGESEVTSEDLTSQATAQLVIHIPEGVKLIGQGTGKCPGKAIDEAVRDIRKKDAYRTTSSEMNPCWAYLRIEHEGKTFWTEGTGKTPGAAQDAASKDIMPKIRQSLPKERKPWVPSRPMRG